MTVDGRQVPVEADRARMRAERHAKLQHQLVAQGLDGLLLLGTSAVAYATGAAAPGRDSFGCAAAHGGGRGRRGEQPHLFTAFPEGAPPELPPDHVHPAAVPDLEDGAAALAAELRELFAGDAVLGCDEVPHPLARALSGIRLQPAAGCSAPPSCARPRTSWPASRPQHVNEQAMLDVQPLLRPGVTQTDLSAGFLRRVIELGAESNGIDPIWQAMPPSLADGPWTVHGDIALPAPQRARAAGGRRRRLGRHRRARRRLRLRLRRTWIVGDDPTPTARQQDQFDRWRAVVDAVLALCKPGCRRSTWAGRRSPPMRAPAAPRWAAARGSSTSTWPTASAPTAPRCR